MTILSKCGPTSRQFGTVSWATLILENIELKYFQPMQNQFTQPHIRQARKHVCVKNRSQNIWSLKELSSRRRPNEQSQSYWRPRRTSPYNSASTISSKASDQARCVPDSRVKRLYWFPWQIRSLHDARCKLWVVASRDHKDRHKTAFTSHYGLHPIVSMPLELRNASNTFQRVMGVDRLPLTKARSKIKTRVLVRYSGQSTKRQ